MDSLDEVDFNILDQKRKVVAGFVKDYPNVNALALWQ